MPAQDSLTINGYGRWEQVFCVFSDVYTRAYPHRSGELIQYNHVIHTISLTFVWDNVYKYDKDFRLHLSRFPKCNWGIILNQSYVMRLKDKKTDSNKNNFGFAGSNNNQRWGYKDACKRYNQGKCTFGVACRFEHKCYFCGKFGHTIKNCRKLMAEKAAG